MFDRTSEGTRDITTGEGWGGDMTCREGVGGIDSGTAFIDGGTTFILPTKDD